MVMVKPDFVYGVVWKSLLLGAIAAIVMLFAVSAEVAGAVVIGTLVSAINLRVVTLSIKKMLEAGLDGGTSATGWTILLALKMFVLIGVIWILITAVEVDAVGFVFGFSLFLPSIMWQVLVDKPDESELGSED
jgi:small-conductance mechanosensitive channel